MDYFMILWRKERDFLSDKVTDSYLDFIIDMMVRV